MLRMISLFALILASVPAVAQRGPPPEGRQGGPGGREGPGARNGRGATPPKPLERETFDKAVTAMFAKGDANRDGFITLEELQGVIDARRDAIIQDRFESIDGDDNGALSMGEFAAWQRQMGSAALSEEHASQRVTELVPATIEPELRDDSNGPALRRLIEPLNATMLVAANANYDSGVTLEELLAYEGTRFDAADLNRDGLISVDEIRPPRAGRPGAPGVPSGGEAPQS